MCGFYEFGWYVYVEVVEEYCCECDFVYDVYEYEVWNCVGEVEYFL